MDGRKLEYPCTCRYVETAGNRLLFSLMNYNIKRRCSDRLYNVHVQSCPLTVRGPYDCALAH